MNIYNEMKSEVDYKMAVVIDKMKKTGLKVTKVRSIFFDVAQDGCEIIATQLIKVNRKHEMEITLSWRDIYSFLKAGKPEVYVNWNIMGGEYFMQRVKDYKNLKDIVDEEETSLEWNW